MRALAQEYVGRVGPRHAARDMGIAYNTLDRFLNEAKPRAGSVRRLEAWYEGEANEVGSLKKRVRDLERKLAECEAKLKRGINEQAAHLICLGSHGDRLSVGV